MKCKHCEELFVDGETIILIGQYREEEFKGITVKKPYHNHCFSHAVHKQLQDEGYRKECLK